MQQFSDLSSESEELLSFSALRLHLCSTLYKLLLPPGPPFLVHPILSLAYCLLFLFLLKWFFFWVIRLCPSLIYFAAKGTLTAETPW